ncbi:MAG: hypothetical protein DRH57_07185 [Candidatus Cloacimonadota bacterium]|nr:MAG: hypothetical protein DRH57_07185 [Candidatus Cloacimonadota bacterium]
MKSKINTRLLSREIFIIGDYKNMKTETVFKCKKNHTWEAKPDNILNKNGKCPYCYPKYKKQSITSINSKLKERGITLLETFKSIKETKIFKCNYTHTWEANIDSVVNGGNGCPFCSNKIKLTTLDYKKELNQSQPYIILKSEYINRVTEVDLSCSVCNHTWSRLPNNKGCPKCNGGITLTRDEVQDKLTELGNGISIIGDYINDTTKTMFECCNGHPFETKWSILRAGSSCPKCIQINQLYHNYDFYKDKPTELYYVKIGTIYKIGVTINGIYNRFKYDSKLKEKNITIEILDSWHFQDGGKAFNIEQSILKETEDLLYTGEKILDGGNTELRIKPFDNIINTILSDNNV